MKITTNNQPREFACRSDVPAAVLADQFDYQDEECFGSFFKYRGTWYHIDQFVSIANVTSGDLARWDGEHGESYFSGVLIRLVDDGERFIVARYTS